ncbi:hypothetical protein R5R35_007614 [Gryllus longicercus]|uniref:Uncharacterized protein n=1 Tax=Gryllus longicercus TaxID=2509291 RepID=A0AAN9V886_9ORTH
MLLEVYGDNSFVFTETNASEWFTTASVPGTFAANIHDSLFVQTEVTPIIAMGVIDPCTQVAFQAENDPSAVEHAATASAADVYASLVKDLFHPCEVSPQVFIDVSHDPCTSEQVQGAILGDESATSVCGKCKIFLCFLIS